MATEIFDGRVLKRLTVPVMAPLTFRRAREADTAELSAIAWAAKAHWGYPQAWLEKWREHLTITAQTLRSEQVWLVESAVGVKTGVVLAAPTAAATATSAAAAAHGESGIVGFYSLRKAKAGWHLEHLWVRPADIRQGVGRALVEHARQQARAVAVKELLITSDPSAEAFYVKVGAVRTGVERYYLFGTVLRELPLLTLKT